MSKMDNMFDGFDEIDCIMAASCTDEEFYCTDKSLQESALLEADTSVDDIEEYDESDDVAIDIADMAAEDFRRARDSGWETEIDDDVEDVMMDDEDEEDDDYEEFGDDWPDDIDYDETTEDYCD